MWRGQNVLRDLLIVAMGLLSLEVLLPLAAHCGARITLNGNQLPEVAKLFAGIFMTIIPALAILKAGEHGALKSLIPGRLREPIHYFWVTGILSSFLDNAPTYLTFFNTALGKLQLTENLVPDILGGSLTEAHHLEFVRNPDGDINRRSFYGCEYIHWERAEFYGEVNCGRQRG